LIDSLFYYLSIYLFCPGGGCPAGFVAGVAGFCSNPPPWQFGCCPGGSLLPFGVSHDGGCAGVILAAAGVASDETSIDTDSATAIAASAANVTLFVFIFAPYNV
jgi:hypothetical protein